MNDDAELNDLIQALFTSFSVLPVVMDCVSNAWRRMLRFDCSRTLSQLVISLLPAAADFCLCILLAFGVAVTVQRVPRAVD